MIATKFSVKGMTCQSCVETVTAAFKSIQNVSAVEMNLSAGSATLHSSEPISLQAVKKSLADKPKYSVENFSVQPINIAKTESEYSLPNSPSKFDTYKPLIIVFVFVLLVSLAYQIFASSFQFQIFMNHMMAGFFIGLSFFKFLNIKAFAESFSGYDPIAKKFLSYGLVYPFIELLTGLLFISGKFLFIANIITVVILSVTTLGVIKRLQSKTQFQCACLGTTFSLPLSNVTIFENVVMISMAAFNVLRLLT